MSSLLSRSSVMLLVFSGTLVTVRAAPLEKSWTLYHSINNGQDFTKRGSVVLSVDPETDGSVDLSIINDNSTLNEETFGAVKTTGSMYQLKLVSNNDNEGGGADTGSSDFILSSVPGCQLLRAQFRDELVISLGPKASAISMTYIPLVSQLAPKSCEDSYYDNPKRKENLPNQGWESRISWETATPGMTLRAVMPQYRPPPGLKWLPRLGTNGKLYQAQGPPGAGGDEKGGKGGNGQQQAEMDATPMGFIRRYWYILLPLFLMNFVGADPPPQEGQPQQGAGAAQQQRAAPAAAAAPPAPAPKQRRGKRG